MEEERIVSATEKQTLPREEQVEFEVPLIVSGNIRDVFRQKLRKLVFRRIREVFKRPEDRICTMYVVPDVENGDETVTVYGADAEVPRFTEDQYKRNIEEQYSAFDFVTSDVKTRKEDRTPGSIYGSSKTVAQLDLINFQFYDYDPASDDERTRTMLPREGDLVCGLVTRKSNRMEYTKWFICSDQFLHAWTAIMYDDHDSLTFLANGSKREREMRQPTFIVKTEEEIAAIRSAPPDPTKTSRFRYVTFEELEQIERDEEIWLSRTEERLRRKLFSGNTLQTNTYLKWILSCHESNLKSDPDMILAKFHALRTEFASRFFIHVYAALVLICRYNEWPCDYNVPNNIGEGPRMNTWDVPDGWLDALSKTYGITVQMYVRQGPPPIQTFIKPPKGTSFKPPTDDEYTVIVFSGGKGQKVKEADL